MNKYKICGVILASGLSKRMGESNKLLALVNEKPLISYPIEECMKAKEKGILEDVVVVTSYNEIIHLAKKYNADFIINKNNLQGQSVSIHLGVKHFYKYDGIAFFMGDMPFVKCKDIEHICNNFQDEILIPKKGENPTNPVVFPKKYYNELLEIRGDVGGKCVIKKHEFQEVEVDYNTEDVDNEVHILEVNKYFNV